VSWFGGKGGWIVYLLIIVLARFLLFFVPFLSVGQAWNITTLLHAVGSFVLFHWDKGLPFVGMDQGKYAKLTMWEQLDKEVQFTPTRKVFTIVPVFLFMLTAHYTDYDLPTLAINLVALAVLLLAKFPHMHKVRIFNINSSPSG